MEARAPTSNRPSFRLKIKEISGIWDIFAKHQIDEGLAQKNIRARRPSGKMQLERSKKELPLWLLFFLANVCLVVYSRNLVFGRLFTKSLFLIFRAVCCVNCSWMSL
jgi:hypothetical protein